MTSFETNTVPSEERYEGPTEADPLLQRDLQPDIDSKVVVVTDKKLSAHNVKLNKLRNVTTAVCLWLGYLAVSAAYSLFGPFFPEEAADKGASPTIVGIIISCSPLCVVIFSPLFGYFMPRLGLRFTLMSGLFLVGGAFVLLGFVASPQISSGWMFITFCILLRMTEGIGSSMFFTATFALLPEIFPDHVGTVMGLFEVGGGIGFSIGPPIGGLLYTVGGFELPFHLTGGVILLFLIPCFLLIKPSESKSQGLSWNIIKILGSNFTIIILIGANILSLASFSFLTPTLQPFLSKHFSLDPLHIGLVFLSGPLTYMLCALVIGPLSDKLGPRYFIIGGLLLFGISFVFIGPADFISSPQLWITIVAFVVLGVGAAFGIVPIYTDMLLLSKRIVPSDVDSEVLTSVLSGVVSSTLSLGEFIGPLTSGGLNQYFDFQTSCLLFGEIVFAEGLLLLGVTVINRVLVRTESEKSTSQ